MDPMFLNMGLQPPPPSLSLGNSSVPTTLGHLNGLPQESKLASYISNRQQQQPSAVSSILPQPTSASVTKTLAALSLDINGRKASTGGLGTDFLPTSNSIPPTAPTGLAHSSSTPSFHSFNSTQNSSFTTSLNTNSTKNSMAGHNNANNNPLAAHNFPALTNNYSINNITTPATTMQYSVAVNHRSSPSMTMASPRPISPPPPPPPVRQPHQESPDILARSTSPSEDASAAAFQMPDSFLQEHIGGTTYFYNAQEMAALGTNGSSGTNAANSSQQSIAGGANSSSDTLTSTMLTLPTFNVAPPTLAHIHHLRTPTSAPHFFVQDELKRQLLEKQTLAMAHVAADQFPDLPREVDYYHELVPQDNPNAQHKSNMFGYATSVYKATHSKTGVQYCLYRVHGYRLNNVKVTQIVDMWKKLQHSGLVQLREVFTTKVFSDNSIIFVYDYHPGSETLCSRFSCNAPLQPGWESAVLPPPSVTYTTETAQQQALLSNGTGSGREMVSEAVLWNFVIQLTGAVRVIHNGGLACRMLDASKVLLTDNCNRLRINCCGILDVLNFDPNVTNPLASVPHNQQEDLVQLGKLILGVSLRACGSGTGLQRDKVQSALELIQRTYSRDLSMLILCLLTQSRIKNINDVMPMIGARFYTAVECATQRFDVSECELGKELHNGRLFRLITKLSTIVDRPYVNNDRNWCETGDRYMLKLFRDYLFYQTHEDGRPWLDLGHIVSVLNKLDSGSPDQLVLMSHDGQNVLVTTYSELKTCFLRSFTELMQASSTTTPTHKLS